MSATEIIQGWWGNAVGTITAIGVLFNIREVVRGKRATVAAAGRAEAAAVEAATHARETAASITELAENTNSIKDALVKVTGEAAHAAGVEQGRAEGKT